MAEEPTHRLTQWMEGYLRAWTSNWPDDIRAIFTEDARYSTAPWRNPVQGRDAIVEDWMARGDEEGTWEFTWSPVAVTDDVAVVRGETRYASGTAYSNLWIIRLDPDGRAREFVEYWMDQAEKS